MTTLTTPLLDCLVTDAAQVADGVIQLTLQAVINRPLPAWRPGAHIDLLLPIGVQRHYSLCGDPADRRRWRIAVLRHPGGRGGSDYIHAALRPGAELSVRGPRNRSATTSSSPEASVSRRSCRWFGTWHRPTARPGR
jgi:ferredoxin-NADP reductase